jgi:RNA polymerase sigma-70 factor (ECF subfamily)
VTELRLTLPDIGNESNLCGGMPFAEVVERHWNAMYRLVYRLTGNGPDADDLTQETFVRALARREAFQPGTNLRAWLMRIASNVFFDLERRRKTARAVPLDENLARGDGPEAGPAEQAELSEVLAAAIAQLPETQRVVFLLRSQEELSFREIAAALDLTEETARWHMLQARRQLLARLDGQL